jgi:hypothetical protein
MLRYLFAFIVFIHGLIHFMGFSKAFGYGNMTQLTKDISKPAGVLWLLTAFLLIATTVLFLLKKDSWPIISILAVILSQILIIGVWKDAKFGSIANLIVLLVAVPALANIRFNKMVNQEVSSLLSQPLKNSKIISNEMLDSLPSTVQKWLIQSGVVGKKNVQFARLKQKGEMRIKQNGKWMNFTATQYFNANDPAFIWQTEVQMMPMVTLAGRDKFADGNGNMLIKVLALINVANSGGDAKINESTMMRYLAEICLFPTAALSPYIKWETVDSLAAKATMNYKGLTVSGIYRFHGNGDMSSFTGNRWYGGGKNATLEKWFIETTGTKEFNGIRIPYKTEVTWKLKSGDFKWLKLEITDLEFNKPTLYHETLP